MLKDTGKLIEWAIATPGIRSHNENDAVAHVADSAEYFVRNLCRTSHYVLASRRYITPVHKRVLIGFFATIICRYHFSVVRQNGIDATPPPLPCGTLIPSVNDNAGLIRSIAYVADGIFNLPVTNGRDTLSLFFVQQPPPDPDPYYNPTHPRTPLYENYLPEIQGSCLK